MKYPSGGQMNYLKKFMLSEGNKYQELELAKEDLIPHFTKSSNDPGLDGWAFMMRTPDKKMVMAYFENQCQKATITGLIPDKKYIAKWFNPRTGDWIIIESGELKSNAKGEIVLPSFPGNKMISDKDWALKLVFN